MMACPSEALVTHLSTGYDHNEGISLFAVVVFKGFRTQ